MRRSTTLAPLVVGILLNVFGSPAYASILGPTPYLSFSDSPFAQTDFHYFYLEDFEDGLLNVPGVEASAGTVLTTGVLRDSVDADDGLIDGSGTSGYSYYTSGSTTISFTFDANLLGFLPNHVGVVLTDIGFLLDENGSQTSTIGGGKVVFEAFGPLGESLGSVGPVVLTDSLANGGTEEDRFFGAIYHEGISKISLTVLDSNDWELDHLQYGYAAPEQSSLLIWIVGISVVLGRRRSVCARILILP
jgi:hypothetical protein